MPSKKALTLHDVSCNLCGQHYDVWPPLTIPCPICHARPGTTCKRPSGHEVWDNDPMRMLHREREQLALDLNILKPCPNVDKSVNKSRRKFKTNPQHDQTSPSHQEAPSMLDTSLQGDALGITLLDRKFESTAEMYRTALEHVAAGDLSPADVRSFLNQDNLDLLHKPVNVVCAACEDELSRKLQEYNPAASHTDAKFCTGCWDNLMDGLKDHYEDLWSKQPTDRLMENLAEKLTEAVFENEDLGFMLRQTHERFETLSKLMRDEAIPVLQDESTLGSQVDDALSYLDGSLDEMLCEFKRRLPHLLDPKPSPPTPDPTPAPKKRGRPRKATA